MSWHTRRLYALEHAHMVHLPPISHREARAKMLEVWTKHAPPCWREHPPTLEYGPGIQVDGSVWSFTEGRARIVLAPDAREIATLLHETTHALRNGDVSHGPSFVGKFFRLLVDEGLTTAEELALAATRHRLDPRWIKHFDGHGQ